MQGINLVVLVLLLGKWFGLYVGVIVYVFDVVWVYVLVLDLMVFGNQSYIFSQLVWWNDVIVIVKWEFFEVIKIKLLVMGGSVKIMFFFIDVSLIEEMFGFKFVSYEDQVINVVEYFLELWLCKKIGVQMVFFSVLKK